MRRLVDITVAGSALILLSPLLAALALVVAATMGRPVLFRQVRIGLNGRPFTILKFRSMRAGRSVEETDAARLTAVGRGLRALSLDELPQLVNILRGDMSLIGPRPTLPEQVARYAPRQHKRHAVRPGITGWAQVNGRNALAWPDRIELDLWYIEHRSLWLDLRIVGRTLVRVLRPHGLYGEGGVNPGFPAGVSEPEPRSD